MKRNTTSAAAKAFKKVKKESISTLKKKVWTVFSKWIRERDNYTCYTCGKKYTEGGEYEGNVSRSSIHAGHFISRRMNATFFDEMNVHAQCMFCNMWDYGAAGPYAEKLIAEYGIDEFKALIARSKTTKQFSRQELQDLLTKYQQP
jgi:hypothetical protein